MTDIVQRFMLSLIYHFFVTELSTELSGLSRGVVEDFDIFEGHQYAAFGFFQHLFNNVGGLFNFFFIVHHFHQYRQIAGPAQDIGGMHHLAVRAETFDPPYNRRPCDAFFPQAVDDGFVKGFAVITVLFANIDPQSLTGPFDVDFHGCLQPIITKLNGLTGDKTGIDEK